MISTASRRSAGDLDSQYRRSSDGSVSEATENADLSIFGKGEVSMFSIIMRFIGLYQRCCALAGIRALSVGLARRAHLLASISNR